MFINGRVMDKSKVLDTMKKGNNNVTGGRYSLNGRRYSSRNGGNRKDLDWREINFDMDISRGAVDFLKQATSVFKAIKLTQCRGQVNDIVFAVMSMDKCEDFQYSEVNKQGDGVASRNPDMNSFLTALSFGLKYSTKNLKKITLSVDFSAKNDREDDDEDDDNNEEEEDTENDETNDNNNNNENTAANNNTTAQNINEDRAMLFRFFFRALALNTTLEELTLAGSTLKDYTMTNLRFALCVNKALVSLNLNGCRLSDEQVALLCETLQDHPLQRLSLQQNSVHDKSMANLAILLHLDQLVELDLSYLIRRPPPPKKKEESIVDKKKDDKEDEKEEENQEEKEEEKEEKKDDKKEEDKPKEEEPKKEEEKKEEKEEKKEEEKEKEVSVENKSLKLFHMAGNHLGDGAVETLLGIFNKNSALENLNLLGNRISDNGVDKIIRMLLERCEHLRVVNLSLNPFGQHGSERLLETIKRTCFSLEECHIDQGTSSMFFGDQSYKDEIQEQIDYYCDLNVGGRRILGHDDKENPLPLGLWPVILERAHNEELINYHDQGATATDVVYNLLLTNPDLTLHANVDNGEDA